MLFRCSLALLAFALLLAGASPAAARVQLFEATASSAASGHPPRHAADVRSSSFWTPRRAGPWKWAAETKLKTKAAAVRIRVRGRTVRATLSVSAGTVNVTRVRAVVLRPGRWTTVNLSGRTVRAVQLMSAQRRGARPQISDVHVVAADDSDPAPPVSDPSPSPPTDSVPGAPQHDIEPSARRTLPSGPAPALVPVGGAFAGVVTDPTDPAQLTLLPFGTRSHWLQPWRAYEDTPPAAQLRDAPGINFNVAAAEAPHVARLLAASGFQRARIEIQWGQLQHDSPSRVRDEAGWRTKIAALRDHGLRPLLLLNTDDTSPVPSRPVTLNITGLVMPGARTVQLDAASAAQVIPGRTGFDATRPAELLITAVSGNTATLSQPMPAFVLPGAYPATTLKHEPFSPLTKADGTPNPSGQQTMNGWLDYVDTVTGLTRDVLGSSQFDVEISNEANLHAAFYDINTYYDPDPYPGRVAEDDIVKRTVEHLRDPSAGLPDIRITNGFASQRPWDSAQTSPAGLDAISKHYYPRNIRFPSDALASNQPLDAHGRVSGSKDLLGRWQDAFSPAYDSFFPEQWLTGIATETIIRDLAPITTQFTDLRGRTTSHGRNVTGADGNTVDVWMTEMGLETGWAHANGTTISRADGEHLRAKATLRTLVSYVGKGVTNVDFYAAGTMEWGLIGDSFWTDLLARGVYPGDTTGGETMDGVRRLTAAAAGPPVTQRRALTLAAVGDYAGRVQFAGAGTAAHPPLHDRDTVLFQPFQTSDSSFVCSVHVMTRNMAKVQNPARPVDDPSRFDLPAERYQMIIGGVDAQRARVSASDPLTGQTVPVAVVARSDTGWMTVEMPVTDSPRLLKIDD